MSDQPKSSEDLIREAKESLRRPPTNRSPDPKAKRHREPAPAAADTRRPSGDKTVATGLRPRPQGQPAPAAEREMPDTQPARRGLWKLISFISLGWVALVSISIAGSIFDQPDDAFELVLGGVVITLIPLLIGIYAVRRGRRSRHDTAPGGTA